MTRGHVLLVDDSGLIVPQRARSPLIIWCTYREIASGC